MKRNKIGLFAVLLLSVCLIAFSGCVPQKKKKPEKKVKTEMKKTEKEVKKDAKKVEREMKKEVKKGEKEMDKR